MGGSYHPHDEGTHPYTREHLRARFADIDPTEVRTMLTDNAAKLYDFDLDALAPLAEKVGPTVGEVAEPIDEVPDKKLERLSSDLDPKAIK
jgi:Fe-S-cluster formation regulator IscX/YfhJ